jgi:putative ABC transport system ATP-binding protein
MREAVHATRIQKSFKTTQAEVLVLQDVSFSVLQGSRTALLGQTRSGKTTLLRLLAGLEPVMSGTLTVYDYALETLDDAERAAFRREVIGFVSPEVPWLPQLSLQDNVALPLLLANASRRTAEKRAAEVCAYLELPTASSLTALSPLERQQWALARGLIHEPKLLLVDGLETLEGEAELFVEQLFECCSDLMMTLMFSTRQARVAAFAEQILSLKHGRLESSGMARADVRELS